MSRPSLRTERLLLRPFAPDDAPRARELAGEWEVATMTLSVPHPYEEGMAEAWIDGQEEAWEMDGILALAVAHGTEGLVGAVGLEVAEEHGRAELGYWMGKPYWGRGFATEAARAMVGHAFDGLGLHRVAACTFARNPASGRVLEKVGMAREGRLRGHMVRHGRREDVVLYGILADDGGPGATPEPPRCRTVASRGGARRRFPPAPP